MFVLVDRIEDYPQFLPWCGGSTIHERTPERTAATVFINCSWPSSPTSSTENTKQEPFLMDLKLKDGPFDHLDGHWRFTPPGDTARKVEFRLHYEFSSQLLEKALGPVFHHITNTFVDSFVKRARMVYG